MASAGNTQVLVVTADPAFAAAMRATFGASSAIELTLVAGTLAEHADTLDLSGMTVVVVDFDAGVPATSVSSIALEAPKVARMAAAMAGSAVTTRTCVLPALAIPAAAYLTVPAGWLIDGPSGVLLFCGVFA